MADPEDPMRAALLAEVEWDVQYHPPGPVAVAAHQAIREATLAYAAVAIDRCPRVPELRAGLQKLTDEVMAHFNAAIARNPDKIPDRGDDQPG